MTTSIRAIDTSSIHRITSGQVVVDLQTAVKELVENSLDAGATNIEVRFKEYGVQSVEVIDNGSGVAEADHDSIALNHHTSKLTSFSSLTTLSSFGFRGEALSSLCALCESVAVATATEAKKGVGVKLEMGRRGDVSKKTIIARQRGTTVTLNNLFTPLPVRRKEFERNAKREFGKAMGLLTGYALIPCAGSLTSERAVMAGENDEDVTCTKAATKGVRLTVSNVSAGKKQAHILSPGSGSTTFAISQALWGSKALEAVQEFHLELSFEAPKAKGRLSSSAASEDKDIEITVRGLISKFAFGCGRTSTDRQFFYVNGRPCSLNKIQKAFNEVYRSFNTNQAPFIIADFHVPRDAVDINVSPDKRTLFLHSEDKLIAALKAALEGTFSHARSTYSVGKTQSTESTSTPLVQTLITSHGSNPNTGTAPPASDPKQTPEAEAKAPRVKRLSRGAPNDISPEQSLFNIDQGDSDFTMGDPHLLIDTPQAPKSAASELYPTVIVDSAPVTSTKETASRDPGEVMTAGARSQLPVMSPVGRSTSDNDALHIEKRQLTQGDASSSVPPALDCDAGIGVGDLDATGSDLDPEITVDSPSCAASPSANRSIREKIPTASRTVSGLPYLRTNLRVTSTRCNADRIANMSGDTGKRPIQLVLNTSGAAWNLSRDRPADERDTAEHVRKKSRLDSSLREDTTSTALRLGRVAKNPTMNFRERLSEFARAGSQAVDRDDIETGRLLEDDDATANDEPMDEPSTIEDVSSGVDGPGELCLDEADEVMVVDTEDTLVSTSSSQLTIKQEPSDDTDHTLVSCNSPGDITMLEPVGTSTVSTGIEEHQAAVNDSDAEILKEPNSLALAMRFDLLAVTDMWRQRQAKFSSSTSAESNTSEVGPLLATDAGVSNIDDSGKAAEALSRVIDKTDFAKMDITGQFNLGFIVTRRRKRATDSGEEMDDLFIVDQHAADEKYNFETLQQDTVIKSQKLFKPQPLELTAADELLALDNIDVLRQNGFEVDSGEGSGTGQGQRLQLVAQPVSKGTTFDMKDLEELLHLMHDRPTGQMVRCSKARAMFAMRACRKSVMVGMPLNRSQMTAVVQHMGTMDQPWNCPHGRPTMRHLSDISMFGKRDDKRAVDWTAMVE